MTDSQNFSDNTERTRFELEENGHLAFARYIKSDGVLTIPYVEAAAELRGTGAAGRLMAAVARHARAHGLKVAPFCSYAVAWFRRHPNEADVLAE